MGSAHPLCRWPNSSALRGLSRWTLLETVKLPAIPLIEFRLRVGLCPVLLSRLWRCRSAPLVGFFFPSAHAATKVHFMRVLPTHWVPPSGFGYPLGGLLPSKPRRLCFAPAALLGSPLRSVLLSGGARTFPFERTHLPFHPAVSPPPKASARPDGSRFLSFNPPKSPLRLDVCLAR